MSERNSLGLGNIIITRDLNEGNERSFMKGINTGK